MEVPNAFSELIKSGGHSRRPKQIEADDGEQFVHFTFEGFQTKEDIRRYSKKTLKEQYLQRLLNKLLDIDFKSFSRKMRC